MRWMFTGAAGWACGGRAAAGGAGVAAGASAAAA